MLEVMFITQQKQHTLSLNPQSTIQEFLWTYIYVHTYIHTYIHTYKWDLRIAANLLHVYSPIANALGNNMKLWLETNKYGITLK